MVSGKLGRYARGVSIIGIGATPFCDIGNDPELTGLTEGEFFGHAALMAMADAGLEEAVKDVASGAHEIVLSGCVEMACGLPLPGQPAHLRRRIKTEDIIPDLEAIMDRAYTRALGGGHIGQDDWIDLYRKEYGLTDEQVDLVLNTMSYHGRRAAALNPLAMFQTPMRRKRRNAALTIPWNT